LYMYETETKKSDIQTWLRYHTLYMYETETKKSDIQICVYT
jgi:hypothetical protein